MIVVEKSIVIGRSIEDVFAYVSDQTKRPTLAGRPARGSPHDRRPARRRHRAHIRAHVDGPQDGRKQRVHAVGAQQTGRFQGHLRRGGPGSVVPRRTGRHRQIQAYVPARDAGTGPAPRRGALDVSDPATRRRGQPHYLEGPARSKCGRSLGPGRGAGLSTGQPSHARRTQSRGHDDEGRRGL